MLRAELEFSLLSFCYNYGKHKLTEDNSFVQWNIELNWKKDVTELCNEWIKKIDI